ncbi:Tyrosine recombinase XerD [Streptomonospora litoralis]|uniref:Tyrosine recombinase XerD n=1 Tax=Streptomonospora litoralis TaxID=2498135 RepID=A0A4P6PZJ5_9ACTN|nr:Tyrosine recombinase XerD [Streptomonospora litoralis]
MRKDAGLDGLGLTPHKLRHTAASLAIAAGADVKVVQQMLGHATATMTLDTYGHLFPDRLDEVADAMDAGRMKAAAARANAAPARPTAPEHVRLSLHRPLSAHNPRTHENGCPPAWTPVFPSGWRDLNPRPLRVIGGR